MKPLREFVDMENEIEIEKLAETIVEDLDPEDVATLCAVIIQVRGAVDLRNKIEKIVGEFDD